MTCGAELRAAPSETFPPSRAASPLTGQLSGPGRGDTVGAAAGQPGSASRGKDGGATRSLALGARDASVTRAAAPLLDPGARAVRTLGLPVTLSAVT